MAPFSWTLRTRVVLLLAILAGGMLATANAALDLTATAEEYVSSGIVYKRLVFKDDNRRVEMEFPQGWTFRTISSTRLELTPPGKGFASAVIQTQPTKTGAEDDAAVNALAEEALAGLPPGSQAATVQQRTVDPAGKEGEVTLFYKNMGYTFRRSVRVVDRPECRLVIQISAPEAEFTALNMTLRRAVQSLSWN